MSRDLTAATSTEEIRLNRPQRSVKPLTPAVLHVLLALAEGPMHGYAIMQAVRETAETGRPTGPGTIYGTLQRLLDSRLVADVGVDPDDARRRIFELTAAGRGALADEARRIHRLADLLRSRRLLTVDE